MKYVIYGANRSNGEEATLTVEASSEADARRVASVKGVLVTRLDGPLPPAGQIVAEPATHGVAPAVSAPDATKSCPFCAEKIAAAAVKCRFCGEFLNGPASTGVTPSAPIDWQQTSPMEAIVPFDLQSASSRFERAANLLGSVTKTDESKQSIEALIKYATQKVKTTIRMVSVDQRRTRVVIQAKAKGALFATGGQNIAFRLFEAFRNLDTPGYEPDTFGMSRYVFASIMVLVGIVVLIVVLLVV